MFPEDNGYGVRAVSDLVVQSRSPTASGLVTHSRVPSVTDLGDSQRPLARSDVHDDDDRMSTYSGGTYSGVPVDYSGCESLLCKACGNAASEQLEWGQHSNIMSEASGQGKRIPVSRVPEGRWCKPCMTTYKSAGWDATYKTPNDYLKFAITAAGRA